MKLMSALSLVAIAGAAAGAAEPDLKAMPKSLAKPIEGQIQKVYVRAATGERVLLTDQLDTRAGDQEQWINEDTNPCDRAAGFYSDFVFSPAEYQCKKEREKKQKGIKKYGGKNKKRS
eukprot:TRINITY_DN29597_c0_g1_i2.p2 TRINITY_DN29597_c0_g1~~TRINITY_DN29597_c0_g1_i2.p2  ORF type:complete len:118 (-),score=18.17 TRINITY_DN29597_c0_g1_i2:9-362(-)